MKLKTEKLEEFDYYNSKVDNSINNEFLVNALDAIIESRRVVAFTYPYGFYL